MSSAANYSSNVVTMRPRDTDAKMQTATMPQDEWASTLLKIARDRDRQAFAAAFRHFAPQIKSYGLSTAGMAGLQAFADELVQETMLKVWRNAAKFDPAKASATTWVFTIARNARIDLIRRGAKHRADIDSDDLWLESDEGEPCDQLEQKRNAAAVRAAISKLPIEQAQIIGKVYLEGKSHSEVAAELALPLGTVKSRVRLALSKMKLLIAE